MLDRSCDTLVKAVKELTPTKKKSVLVEAKNVADYIGVPKLRHGDVEDQDHGRYRLRLSEGEADNVAA